METSLAGLVSFLTMKNRLEMAFQGGGKGAATTRRALCTTPITCGDCSPGIMYHPNCLRRLLDRHYTHPYCPWRLLDRHYAHPYCLRRLLAGHYVPPLLPAATARRALCPPFTCGDYSPRTFSPLFRALNPTFYFK